MEKIIFVTTNPGKVATAKKYLDFEIEIYKHELIEPRSEDIDEIAISKVKQAYELVQKPCIALDAGFFIKKLNGFPKAYVNFALETIGIKGILKLMENVENRKCAFKETLAFYDGKELLLFRSESKGFLTDKLAGKKKQESWSDLWYIFKPNGSNKTLAEMTEAERFQNKNNNKEESSLKKFSGYLKNRS